MVHKFYVGHFEHDEEGICLCKDPASGVLQPIVTRPLDSNLIRDVITEITGDPDFLIPKTWGVWFHDGYLSCNPYTPERKAIQLVAEIAKNDHCEVYRDLFQPARLDDLVYSWSQEKPEESERLSHDCRKPTVDERSQPSRPLQQQ